MPEILQSKAVSKSSFKINSSFNVFSKLSLSNDISFLFSISLVIIDPGLIPFFQAGESLTTILIL